MILSGDTVTFRSTDEWYGAERSGEKPATQRLLSRQEWSDLVAANPTLIEIRHADDDVSFTREIRSKFAIDELLGHVVVEIFWKHALTLGERQP